ncbi:hypothetical protein HDV05_003551 [Chytridiales sp. JEL 0842]|nr:hypothetical protein HDV05_003551 [Chytridiales sp. JEL 0842]
MGKESKKKQTPRHDPLHMEILKDDNPLHEEDMNLPMNKALLKAKKVRSAKGAVSGGAAVGATKAKKEDDDMDVEMDDEKGKFVDAKTSKKLLDMVREQQQEMENETQSSSNKPITKNKKQQQPILSKPGPFLNAKSSMAASDDENSDEEVEEFDEDDMTNPAQWDIDESDAALIDKFMNKTPSSTKVNLADLIMSKINQSTVQPMGSVTPSQKRELQNARPEIDPKVVEVYSKVGVLLSSYRSGKLPKAFKIIPSLSNWEEILMITNPQGWTPHAAYQATRIFVSNLGSKMAQRFFSLFLLDKIRDDIAETKKLNYHLYLALKKSLYKPSAFFKGLLLPLCESGSCTLREAMIIGSVITKVSIPLLDSAAGLLKIAEMDYTGPNSLFIRILLDKKYALPYKVIDALVFHFLRFQRDPRPLPVLWHQSLLVFAQRYKRDVTSEQKEALLELLKAKSHPGITPEIRRELQGSVSRGEAEDIDMMSAL